MAFFFVNHTNFSEMEPRRNENVKRVGKKKEKMISNKSKICVSMRSYWMHVYMRARIPSFLCCSEYLFEWKNFTRMFRLNKIPSTPSFGIVRSFQNFSPLFLQFPLNNWLTLLSLLSMVALELRNVYNLQCIYRNGIKALINARVFWNLIILTKLPEIFLFNLYMNNKSGALQTQKAEIKVPILLNIPKFLLKGVLINLKDQ